MELIKQSKFLSKILRHDPKSAGVILDKNGYASVSEIIKILKIKKSELDEIVETNDKKRFEYDIHQQRIRARQGHSIEVDVELLEFIPTQSLFHGTAYKNLNSIYKTGINKAKRNHVHLSDNSETAFTVGKRHGSSVVLEIDAVKMVEDGLKFFKSNNGVYLTENIPPQYILKETEKIN